MLSSFFWKKEESTDFFVFFKNQMSLSHRILLSQKLMASHDFKIVPVIVDTLPNSGMPELKNHKFLVPKEANLAYILHKIRDLLDLKQEQSIFLYSNNKVLVMSESMDIIWDKYKDVDGFLYIRCCLENTFG